MKRFQLFLVALVASGVAMAYTPNKIVIPNIEGYKTLKGDFHIHTSFSDGTVWPDTRVQEALWEGLDVIAITDHIDTRLQKMMNKGYLSTKCDRDTSYELAKKAAGDDLLVIHGGEISRKMPPGHFNCIFVKDNDDICKAAEKHDDHILATEAGLREARKQGAFLMWNHPNWCKYAPNETIMWPAHKRILKDGYMDAIEVYNADCGYSPEAHDWCLKYDLAIIGCSDSHAPFFTEVDYLGGKHRVVTLVFAKEHSLEGVREAMDTRRTAIFAEGMVYGREQELKPLFEACVKVKNMRWNEKSITFTLENVSSIPVRLSKASGSESVWYSRHIDLQPFSSYEVKVSPLLIGGSSVKWEDAVKEVVANFYVETFHIGAGKPLFYSIKATR